MVQIEHLSHAQLRATPEAIQRFQAMSYGITTHWGLYSLLGRNEWAMHREHIPTPEYEQLMQQFNPTHFNAQQWADMLVEVGAQAFMITSKHHDGFCLFDSALTGYKVTNTPFKRDIIGELAEALHERNIPFHLYYSLLDWHHPAYQTDWDAYVAYYQGQVRELCTNYGEIGGIVFDGYWPRRPRISGQEHFLPLGSWNLTDTYDLIHSLQPQALIVNNHHATPLAGEDYQVWEVDFPGENTIGFNTTEISSLPLASWFTVNIGWSYRKEEQEIKPAEELLRLLTESRRRHATCWLNVGPTPEGEILPAEVTELRRLSQLLRNRPA